MKKYIIRRFLYMIPTLLVAAVVAFLLVHFIPGGPAAQILGFKATPEQIAELNARLGLDRPIIVQFWEWFTGILRGDFGVSLTFNKPVLELIMQRMPITIQLTFLSLIISMLIGIPAGVIAAINQGKLADNVVLAIAIIGSALPEFWLALNLISLLSVKAGIFPPGGYSEIAKGFAEWLRRMTLPAFSLGFIFSASVARMTRSSMLDVLRQDYIKTARAKGQREKVVLFKHALKNALIPIITVVGLNITAAMGGSVVIENVYTLPGVGRMMLNAINGRDYPMVQGIIIVIAFIAIVVNFFVDILYKAVNPKITLDE